MTIEEFVETNLDTLVTHYLHNARFTLMELIMRALNPEDSQLLDTTAEVVARIGQKIEADPEKFLPRKCCATCWGPCSRKCQQLSEGYYTSDGLVCGEGCDSFQPISDFGKFPIRFERVHRRRGPDNSYNQQEFIQLEPGVIQIHREVRNTNTGRILKSKSFTKVLVCDTAKFAQRFLHILRWSPRCDNLLASNRLIMNPAERIIQHGIPLIKGETLDHYHERLAEEVRRRLSEISNESFALDYNAAVEFIKSQLTSSEKTVMETCRNFDEFISLAFPFMNVWQVVESIKQEPLLN